jgi:hypothetical protein
VGESLFLSSDLVAVFSIALSFRVGILVSMGLALPVTSVLTVPSWEIFRFIAGLLR